MTSTTDPAGSITSGTDLLGRVVSYTDAWGVVAISTYDAAGRRRGPRRPRCQLAEYVHGGRWRGTHISMVPRADPPR